jgi:hypothetical protein
MASSLAMTSHYDVSIRWRTSLPAARAASPDTLLVADGTSCRHQIADGTRTRERARQFIASAWSGVH